MIYQHATRDRDQAIAKALGTFVRDVRERPENQRRPGTRARREHEPDRPYGTYVARGAGNRQAASIEHRKRALTSQNR